MFKTQFDSMTGPIEDLAPASMLLAVEEAASSDRSCAWARGGDRLWRVEGAVVARHPVSSGGTIRGTVRIGYRRRVTSDTDSSRRAELERLREAGLYDPDAPSVAQREELLSYLLERFTVDEIEYWVQHVDILGVAARAVDRPPPFISADDVAACAGVDLETVMELRTATGFPVSDPSSESIPETVVDDVATFMLGAELYGRAETLAFARVLGWAASRVLEAARAMFAKSVQRAGADTRTELQIGQANEVGAAAWLQVQPVMAHLLAEHLMRDPGFVRAMVYDDLRVAVAFVDLVSSTEWTEAVEPSRQSEALRGFEMRASRLAVEHGARLVKLIGDEAMLVADDPGALCSTALDLCEMAHADPTLPDARGAVGFGDVTARDGDYFGPLVNTVARASKLAPPGGLVVTAEVARALDPNLWSTEPIGPTELRGVRERVHLSRAVRASLRRS